jgi:hypothetical protein
MWCGRGQESAPPTEVWQGEVEHIQTSQRWTFQALEELVRLLRQQVEEADATEGE